MERRFNTATDRRGNAISGATVTVLDAAGTSATIYSDDGVTTTTNPLTTNSDGEYTYFAKNGRYTETIVADGYGAETLTNVVLFDAMSVDEVTTATYSFSVTDIGNWLDFNTSATATATMSTASGYAQGDSSVVRQRGAGQVVLAAGSNCRFDTVDTRKTRVQKSVIAFTRASDGTAGTLVFAVYGDTATS
jgi:hypothetical protein